uniref:Uncharacterized protein n=1 Tax=Arundo donax TaxID=35708 RepID=A0A0A9V421_ARUDO
MMYYHLITTQVQPTNPSKMGRQNLVLEQVYSATDLPRLICFRQAFSDNYK